MILSDIPDINTVIIALVITFLGWIGREIYLNSQCGARLQQEVKDMHEKLDEFIKEYRDSHR